jgi:hypothetical protein
MLVTGCSGGPGARSSGRSAPSTPAPTIVCDEAIGQAKSGDSDGYRVVLGVVSVPSAYLSEVVETGEEPWAYWRKAGLVIRAGRGPAVSVRVPKTWRKRAAVTWANTGAVSALRIGRCRRGTGWYAYAGGFYLRSRSACVPLVFQVGERKATVRFGIGQRCP